MVGGKPTNIDPNLSYHAKIRKVKELNRPPKPPPPEARTPAGADGEVVEETAVKHRGTGTPTLGRLGALPKGQKRNLARPSGSGVKAGLKVS